MKIFRRIRLIIIFFLLNGCITTQKTINYSIENIDMIFIEGGIFEMGDIWGDGYRNEKPVKTITVQNFYLSKTEVTNNQYCIFLNELGNQIEKGDRWLYIEDQYCLIEEINNRFYPKKGFEEYPVIKVNWYGAKAFCNWLTERTGEEYRLPTEVEWEYAAKGGENQKWSGTNNEDELGDYAWYYENSNGEIHPVAQKKANIFGLYDMSGNVFEWCSDYYQYDSLGNYPVYRGGSWDYHIWYLRCCWRFYDYPNISRYNLGFRICRTVF